MRIFPGSGGLARAGPVSEEPSICGQPPGDVAGQTGHYSAAVMNERLAEIFASSPDVVVWFAPAGAIAYRNAAASARGAPWLPAAFDAELEAALSSVRATGTAAAFEWGEVAGDVVKCWYHAVLTACGGGVLCVSRDITNTKRSLQSLQRSQALMVDTQGVAHLGIWEWDITQPIATWSPELYRIYGLTPETYTPTYEAYLQLVHPDDRARVSAATDRVFRDHVPYSHDERIFRADGTMRYLHTWARALVNEHGALTHLIGVCQDVTDRAHAEHELQRVNAELEVRVLERTKQLEVAMRNLESFNSTLSHDMRGPLAVIQMATELIGDADPDAIHRVNLDRVRRAVTAMATLVNDMLEFARLGHAALQPRQVDLSAICLEAVAELRAGDPSREAAVRIAPGLTRYADPSLIRVVMVNLLSNAWKYTSREPTAAIEVGEVARAGGRAIYVKDNGIGFDMVQSDRLFTPFARLGNASEFPGTGVGLASVRRIVELHGGTVTASSEPGRGATFFIELPESPA